MKEIKSFYFLKDKKIEFDSRKIDKGKVFIALKGKRDGHLFIKDALKRGAIALIVKKEKLKGFKGKDIKLIFTKDTFRFFRNYALFKRRLYYGKKIALTGSVGKTTTKEFLFYLLSKFAKSCKNIESYNNLLGLTYTLSNLDLDAKYYIQELGTNNFGEIEKLTRLLRPNIRILTKVGKAHLKNFKNIEGVIKAKLELFKDNFFDIGILPKDLENYLEKFGISKNNLYFFSEKENILEDRFLDNFERETTIKIFDKVIKVKHNILGNGFLTSLIIGAYLLYLLNLDLNILEDIRDFKLPSHRLNTYNLKIFNKDILIIDDTYNANPTSFENLINILKALKKRYNPKILVVFGYMAELGDFEEKEHKKVLNDLLQISKVYSYNISYFSSYKDKEKLFSDILKDIKKSPEDKIIIALKGSRINKLEDIVNKLKDI